MCAVIFHLFILLLASRFVWLVGIFALKSKFIIVYIHHNWQQIASNTTVYVSNVSLWGSEFESNGEKKHTHSDLCLNCSIDFWALSKLNRCKNEKSQLPTCANHAWNSLETTIEVAFTKRTCKSDSNRRQLDASAFFFLASKIKVRYMNYRWDTHIR